MATEVVTPAPSTEKFDYAKFAKERNERSAAAPVVATATAQAETSTAEHQQEGEDHKLSRADRRRMNNLLRENGELRGRLSALESLRPVQVETKAAAKVETEPKRADFASDAEFSRATAAWVAREETGKLLRTEADTRSQAQQAERFQSEIHSADEIATQQIKDLFPDWDEKAELLAEAERDGDVPAIPAGSVLEALIALSDERAKVLYYLADHIEEAKALLEERDQAKQIRMFHRLEGRVENLFKKQEKQPEKKASQAELDAAKPRPSEALAVRAGSPVSDKVPMFLDEGKTKLNPAWKAQQNARAGLRP